MSYLYIAKFKDRPNSFKVGVADDCRKRLTILERTHGKVDYDFTDIIKIDKKKTAFKIESILHFSFRGHKDANIPKCDGYSEFFKDECYTDLVGFIDSNLIDNIKIKDRVKYLVSKGGKSRRTSDEVSEDIKSIILSESTREKNIPSNDFKFKVYGLNKKGGYKTDGSLNTKHYYGFDCGGSSGVSIYDKKTGKEVRLATLDNNMEILDSNDIAEIYELNKVKEFFFISFNSFSKLYLLNEYNNGLI